MTISEIVNRALEKHDEGDYEHAEQLFLEALYLMDDKDNELYQRIIYGLGMNYSMQKNYDGAKQCFEEARLNARKADNIAFELEMLHQLVILSHSLGDFDIAEVLLEETILYRKEHVPADLLGIAAIYNEGGKLYLLSNHYQKSEQYFQRAMAFAVKAENENSIALIQMELGNLYMHMKDYAKAEQAYEHCRHYYQHHNQKVLQEIELRLQQIKEIK